MFRFLTYILFLLTSQVLFSQERKVPFDVHQILYYENDNCTSDEYQNTYAVVYQNIHEKGKFITYNLNSFNDESMVLFVVNKYKVMNYQSYSQASFNAASRVEILMEGLKDLDDVTHFHESKVVLKFLDKESLIRDNRMLTAYYFKAKNLDEVKKVVYYIDHGSNGVPFSYHQSFYEAMIHEGFPLIGNVVQRDEITRDGSVCSFVLKRIQEPKKKFKLIFLN